MLRKINTDQYAGRTTVTGHARSEKRRGGRIKCSSLTCELGGVADISSSGMRVHTKKKPATQVGDERELTLKCDDEKFVVNAICVWIRVDDRCEFDMGWELKQCDALTRKRLMELAASGQHSEGLARGWSPMQWWRNAG
ncbi:MAG TPA: PilZ domain-containing protein [Phycisphaerales bacterium]|nr:PilZ domain-containing protein [Phycisphaerales bacterium]